MERKKQPFTLPITAMIREGSALFAFMQDVFNDTRFAQHGYFDKKKVLEYCKTQGNTPNDGVANMLWSAMAFELWHRHVEPA